MSPIDQLVRLRKWTLDERRQELAELQRREDELRARIAGIEREVQAEAGRLPADPAAATDFALYAERMQALRRQLEEQLDGLRPRLADAEDRVRDAFGESKSSELVAQEMADSADRLRGRREQARLDEVALQIYRRGAGK